MLLLILNAIRVYISVVLVFILLFVNGVAIFSSIVKTKNKTLLAGGGMATSVLALIFLMMTLSYFLKGPTGITTIFIGYTLSCLYVLRKKKIKVKKLLTPKRTRRNIIQAIVILFFLTMFFLYSRGSPTGGDSSTYFAIATSFARGNYPTVLPSQPQYLTAYHHGALVAMGALHAIAHANISIIYYFFSTYVISALFLFILGMAREESRSFVSFIPAILATIVFGGPVLYTGNIANLLSDLSSIATTMPVNFEDVVLSLGTSANDISSLFYFNYYTLGFLTLLVIVYLITCYPPKPILKKYVILTITLALALSIAEVFFVLGVVAVGISYLVESRNNSFKQIISRSGVLLLLFVALFFVIQNPIRDSMISSNIESTWFSPAVPGSGDFRDRISYMGQRTISLENNISWVLPDFRILVVVIFLLSIIFKSKYGLILSSISLVSVIYSFILVNAYWRPASLRFINQAYQILFLAFGFLLVAIYKSRTKYSKILFAIILLSILPQSLVRNYKFINRAIKRDDGNLVRFVDKRATILDWIEDNIPLNKRVIFIEEYPAKWQSLTHDAMVYHGIFVPTGPVNYKMVSIDFAGEWYDAVTSLSPRSLKELKIDYVFVKNDAQNKFTKSRLEDLYNRDYFLPIFANGEGTFYEIKDAFRNSPDDELTLTQIAEMIPEGKVVYLDRPPKGDARKSLLLLLANRTTLLGPLPNIGHDQFFYIETHLPIIVTDAKGRGDSIPELHMLDYVITGSETDPNKEFDGKFIKTAEIPEISLWHNASAGI